MCVHSLLADTFWDGNLPVLMRHVVSLQDSDLFLLGTDSHKKKKKHSSEEHYHRGEELYNL